MGYISKIEHLKKDFPNAYFKLEIIKWKAYEDEVYVDTELGQELTWEKQTVCEAVFFIYGDQVARNNRVSPLTQVAIPFKFDVHSKLNILQQAYKGLAAIPDFKGGVDVFYDKLKSTAN